MAIVKILLSIPLVLVVWLGEFLACSLLWLPVWLVWQKNVFDALRFDESGYTGSLSHWLMTQLD